MRKKWKHVYNFLYFLFKIFSVMLSKMKDIGIKTSLKLIPAFLAIGIIGTVLGACLYMVYAACTFLIAGEALAVFSISLFLQGVFISFPVCMIVSAMLLTLYLIRHPALPVVPLCMYAALVAVAWLVLIPLCTKFSQSYAQKQVQVTEQRAVSPGFFRHENGYLFYYSRVSYDKSVDGICVDSANNDGKVYTFEGLPLAQTKKNFSDSLIEETIAMPKLFMLLIQVSSILKKSGDAAWSAGHAWWLCFASFGLALLSVVGLRRVTSWRLLNTFVIIFATMGIIILNALYYGTTVLGGVSSIVEDWFSKLRFIHYGFAVFCNTIIAAVFLAWGLCLDIFKKNTELDEEGNPI